MYKMAEKKLTLVDKLVGTVSALIPLAAAPFCRDSIPNTPAKKVLGTNGALINNPSITHYIGNLVDTFAITSLSGFIGNYIQDIGLRKTKWVF